MSDKMELVEAPRIARTWISEAVHSDNPDVVRAAEIDLEVIDAALQGYSA